MVEQIGACHAIGGDAVGAVVDFQHGIGLEPVARRPLHTVVVDADVAQAVDIGCIAHIEHLLATGIAIQRQRLAIEIAPVVHLRGMTQLQFTLGPYVAGIFDGEIIANKLCEGTAFVGEQAGIATFVSLAGNGRLAQITVVADGASVVERTVVEMDVLGSDGACIIDIVAGVGGKL